MTRAIRLVVALATLATCAPLARAADAPLDAPLDAHVRVSLGYHYSTGDYGTDTTTEIHYVPLTLRADVGDFRAKLTIPYLRIQGAGTIVQGPNGPIQTTVGTSDGLGDVLARGTYTLLYQNGWLPFLDLSGVVKFPTASRGKGLGTGRWDAGIETEASWVVGRVVPFVGGGYRFLGSSAAIPLRDVALASGGVQVRLTDRVDGGVLVDWRQAASSESGERLEIIPFAGWIVTDQWSVNAYASAGLADGSPDAGVGVEVGYAFTVPLGAR